MSASSGSISSTCDCFQFFTYCKHEKDTDSVCIVAALVGAGGARRSATATTVTIAWHDGRGSCKSGESEESNAREAHGGECLLKSW
jgi:hypothetical protein